MALEIPPILKSDIESGTTVLVLGAGASVGAKSPTGNYAPSGKELSRLLAQTFLGDESLAKDHPLDEIAELAQSEADMFRVQDFIRDRFRDLAPLPHHSVIATFRWHGLATTNYDLLIESGYQATSSRAQTVIPFMKDHERIDDRIRHEPDAIPLLKLHGCISRTSDKDCPLILTIDQYISHRTHRNRLFERFTDWATEHTVVFVGYSLRDPDIRAILKHLTETLPSRPRYYVVSPSPLPAVTRAWEAKRVTTIDGTAADFFSTLDNIVKHDFRAVRRTFNTGILGDHLSSGTTLSSRASTFLNTDVDVVSKVKTTELIPAKEFYRGYSAGWSSIEQSLDVRRRATDAILADFFIAAPPADTSSRLIVVKAHAGAGKTIFLRRLAWDAARQFQKLVFWLRENCTINAPALIEIATEVKEPLFLFVDDILIHTHDVLALLDAAESAAVSVTIIGAARNNEWNQADSSLVSRAASEPELHFLSEVEIATLLQLLEHHRALGRLEPLDHEQRMAAFVDRAQRQLLVALHEATVGPPFEQILVDEYNRITPPKARDIYLTVCMLSRFNVKVRAGIISRLYGVSFRDFREHFFSPLDQVVKSSFDDTIRDYVYSARHPQIAEIVIREVLREPHECSAEIVRSLTHLNLDFRYDRIAFNNLIRAKQLSDLVADVDRIREIYRVAEQVAGRDWRVLHQNAIFEMQHCEGDDFSHVEELLRDAHAEYPANEAISHTLAELRLTQAKSMPNRGICERMLSEAESICLPLRKNASDAHPYHTLMKIGVERLNRALQDDSSTDEYLEKLVEQIDRHRSDGLTISPDDQYILSTEATVLSMLEQRVRVKDVLERALKRNAGNSYIAIRLARVYAKQGEMERAVGVLRAAVDANPIDKGLHLEFARCLALDTNIDLDVVIYHLSRSYRSGDRNAEARFLHAAYAFEKDGWAASRQLFRDIDSSRSLGFYVGYPKVLVNTERRGSIIELYDTWGKIQMDGRGDHVFIREQWSNAGVWERLQYGSRVRFRLGFTHRGAAGVDLEVDSQ